MQFFDEAVLSLHLDADEPIEAKIAKLQDLLAGYFHANGMMYSLSYYNPATGELRPLRDSDFDGQSIAALPSDSASRPGFYHGENSLWTAGLFLWSQCLRYQATGEQEALRLAERAFGSLGAIFAMTDAAGDPGFLAKPYDWEISHETSPDQCIAAARGMWIYRQLAGPAALKQIDHWLPALADWWRRRDYTLTYFGACFKILDSPCHLPIMPCLQHMAYQVTGGQRYLTECRRLLDLAGAWPTHFDRARARMVAGDKPEWVWPKLAEGCEYDPSRRPYLMLDGEFRYGAWMTLAAAEYFAANEPALLPLLKNAIGRIYRYGRFGLTEDLLTRYWIQIDLERDTWHPLRRPPTAESLANAWLKWDFLGYCSDVCWGDAAMRVADMGVVGHLLAPEFCPGGLALARDLLRRLDSRRLTHMVDPDSRQLLPQLSHMVRTLSSDTPAFTLLTYWRARASGLEV